MSSSQANIRIRLAERQLARYREDVGDWQVEHDALAQDCWPIEDLIENGNHYLRSILRLNEAAKSEGAESSCKTDAILAVRYHLRGWLEVSEKVLHEVEKLEKEYGHLEGADRFREDIERVRYRLVSSKPIHIDELGRVFDENGELVLLPGLTSNDILDSLADEGEGRLVPFTD